LIFVKIITMDILIAYALSFVGTPYIWDKNDCSAYVQEVLASAGVDPPGDQTAQGLFDHFSKNGAWNKYVPGALAFYGPSSKDIKHVAFLISPYQMVESGGGDFTTVTYIRALIQDAQVRVRPVRYRKDLIAVILPDYSAIGLMY